MPVKTKLRCLRIYLGNRCFFFQLDATIDADYISVLKYNWQYIEKNNTLRPTFPAIIYLIKNQNSFKTLSASLTYCILSTKPTTVCLESST